MAMSDGAQQCTPTTLEVGSAAIVLDNVDRLVGRDREPGRHQIGRTTARRARRAAVSPARRGDHLVQLLELRPHDGTAWWKAVPCRRRRGPVSIRVSLGRRLPLDRWPSRLTFSRGRRRAQRVNPTPSIGSEACSIIPSSDDSWAARGWWRCRTRRSRTRPRRRCPGAEAADADRRAVAETVGLSAIDHDRCIVPRTPPIGRIACQPVRMANLGRWLAWLARLAWLLVAIVGGSAVEQAVDSRSDAVRFTAGIGCWVGWAIVMLALVIASVRTLTVVARRRAARRGGHAGRRPRRCRRAEPARLGAPAAVAIARGVRRRVRAVVHPGERVRRRRPVSAAGAGGGVGRRRLTWILWAARLLTGPMLIAARSWVAGAVLTIAAIAGLVLLGPRWHRLARRWLVFVPAGVVLHDPVVLADTVSLRDRSDHPDPPRPRRHRRCRPDRPGERLRPRGADHRVDHGRIRVHAVGAERPGDPPDRFPRLARAAPAARSPPPPAAASPSAESRAGPDERPDSQAVRSSPCDQLAMPPPRTRGVGRVVQHHALARSDRRCGSCHSTAASWRRRRHDAVAGRGSPWALHCTSTRRGSVVDPGHRVDADAGRSMSTSSPTVTTRGAVSTSTT